MKMRIGLCVLMLSVMATTTAQTMWPTKPYTEWTLNEVRRILYNSPWTQANFRVAPNPNTGTDTPNYPPGTNYLVQIQLYSALPVRQAIVRRMQLTIPYEKLTTAQRASFDDEIDGLLKCPNCAEHYIVILSSSSKERLKLVSGSTSVTLDIIAAIKRVPEDELLRHVSLLNDKGERRNAARVVFTQRNEVVLLFRRLDDQGNPLISATNTKFYVDFDDYLSKKAEGALKKFAFDVRNLVHDGEVMF
jgi:hypothetical protein